MTYKSIVFRLEHPGLFNIHLLKTVDRRLDLSGVLLNRLCQCTSCTCTDSSTLVT